MESLLPSTLHLPFTVLEMGRSFQTGCRSVHKERILLLRHGVTLCKIFNPQINKAHKKNFSKQIQKKLSIVNVCQSPRTEHSLCSLTKLDWNERTHKFGTHCKGNSLFVGGWM